MQPSFQAASISMPAISDRSEQSLQSDDRVYQAMTIAAILMVLGSLWIF